MSGGSGYPEKQWELLVSHTALESLELSRQFKLFEDIRVLLVVPPWGDLRLNGCWSDPQNVGLMPALPPAVSGCAASSGGGGCWCASLAGHGFVICLLTPLPGCFCFLLLFEVSLLKDRVKNSTEIICIKNRCR